MGRGLVENESAASVAVHGSASLADQQALHAFAQWVASCSGNEKQEGQTFVQKLLTAWGWEDATEAGVSFEHKIPKGGAGGGRVKQWLWPAQSHADLGRLPPVDLADPRAGRSVVRARGSIDSRVKSHQLRFQRCSDAVALLVDV